MTKPATIGLYYPNDQSPSIIRAKELFQHGKGYAYIRNQGRKNEETVYITEKEFKERWRPYPPRTGYEVLTPGTAREHGVKYVGNYIPHSASGNPKRARPVYRDSKGLFHTVVNSGKPRRVGITEKEFSQKWSQYPPLKISPETAWRFGMEYLGLFRKPGHNQRPKDLYRDEKSTVCFFKYQSPDWRMEVGDFEEWEKVGK